jgi:methyl coenzyme M reductase alpha subunit
MGLHQHYRRTPKGIDGKKLEEKLKRILHEMGAQPAWISEVNREQHPGIVVSFYSSINRYDDIIDELDKLIDREGFICLLLKNS